MNLPGPKRLTFRMSKEIADANRDDLLVIAKKRLKSEPDKYHQHIYGEEEAGGTCILNISSIPLEQFGYPKNLPKTPLINTTSTALKSIPGIVIGLGAALGLIAFITNQNDAAKDDDSRHQGDKL